MSSTADFVGSESLIDCALIHKYEYFWPVAVPLNSKNLKFESPIVHTVKGTFHIAWKFDYSMEDSGNNFVAKLLFIDNKEVDVFFNIYVNNLTNPDYKICVMEDKFYKHQSSEKCWKTVVEDSKIYNEYKAKLVHLLRTGSNNKSFQDLLIKFHVEFKVVEMESHVKSKLKLSKDLGVFRSQNKTWGDVTFVTNEKEFQAHKSILIARSPVFATMLSIDMQEKRNNRINVDDIGPEVFELFLDFVYSGRVDRGISDCDAWAELLFVAEKYGLDDLKGICMDMTASLFSIENMTKIFAIANLMNDEILKQAAVDFVVRQEESVKQSKEYNKLVEEHPFILSEKENSK